MAHRKQNQRSLACSSFSAPCHSQISFHKYFQNSTQSTDNSSVKREGYIPFLWKTVILIYCKYILLLQERRVENIAKAEVKRCSGRYWLDSNLAEQCQNSSLWATKTAFAICSKVIYFIVGRVQAVLWYVIDLILEFLDWDLFSTWQDKGIPASKSAVSQSIIHHTTGQEKYLLHIAPLRLTHAELSVTSSLTPSVFIPTVTSSLDFVRYQGGNDSAIMLHLDPGYLSRLIGGNGAAKINKHQLED